MYPPAMSGDLYSGIITTELPATDGLQTGGTGARGTYTNEAQSTNRINIPASSEIQRFVIDNITVVDDLKNSGTYFSFAVSGKNTNIFGIRVDIDKNYKYTVTQSGVTQPIYKNIPISNGIDLTSYYNTSLINSPNSLVITDWESPQAANEGSDLLNVRFVICDKTNPC